MLKAPAGFAILRSALRRLIRPDRLMRRGAAIVLIVIAAGTVPGTAANRFVGTVTGLPLPRFVSLKAARANVRYGPGLRYDVKWTYVRRGVPLEILEEYGHWRQVRDWQGKRGWIHGAMLSSHRTAFVTPWDDAGPTSLRAEPSAEAAVVATLHANVLIRITSCEKSWCNVAVDGYSGYIPQNRVWGVYPDETLPASHGVF